MRKSRRVGGSLGRHLSICRHVDIDIKERERQSTRSGVRRWLQDLAEDAWSVIQGLVVSKPMIAEPTIRFAGEREPK